MGKYDTSPAAKSLGGLWKNPNRAHPNAPDYIGNLKIKKRELLKLLEKSDASGHVVMSLAAWKNGDVLTIEAQVRAKKHDYIEPEKKEADRGTKSPFEILTSKEEDEIID